MTMHNSGANFDIDVDVTALLHNRRNEKITVMPRQVVIDSRYYELAMPTTQRHPYMQRLFQHSLQTQIFKAQWMLGAQQAQERRLGKRAGIISRVKVANGDHFVACDISTHGLRCSGRPKLGTFDVEFKVPGLAFPVSARAEVVDFKNANVLPLVHLKFVDIEETYQEHIAKYVTKKTGSNTPSDPTPPFAASQQMIAC